MSRLALCIGINAYPLHVGPLDGCVDDARAMARFLASPRGGSFESVVPALDLQATGNEVVAALQETARFEWEQLVVFFAGHGGPKGIELFDGTLSYGVLARLLGAIRARAKLLVLDACMSGRIMDELAGIEKLASVRSALRYARALADACPGLRVVTATDREGLADEDGARGAFTVALLRAAGQARADLAGQAISLAQVVRRAELRLVRDGHERPVWAGSCLDYPFALSDSVEPFGAARSFGTRARRRVYHRGANAVEYRLDVRLIGRRFLPTQVRHVLSDAIGPLWAGEHWTMSSEHDAVLTCRDVVTFLERRPIGRVRSTVIVLDERGRELAQDVRAL